MDKMLHQLIGSSSHYLQGFIHPRWCRISEPSTVWTGARVFFSPATWIMIWWNAIWWDEPQPPAHTEQTVHEEIWYQRFQPQHWCPSKKENQHWTSKNTNVSIFFGFQWLLPSLFHIFFTGKQRLPTVIPGYFMGFFSPDFSRQAVSAELKGHKLIIAGAGSHLTANWCGDATISVKLFKIFITHRLHRHTVDRRNPAPVDVY